MRLAGKTALLWHPAANCIARGVDQNFQTMQMHGLQEQDEAPWQRYVLTRQLRSSWGKSELAASFEGGEAGGMDWGSRHSKAFQVIAWLLNMADMWLPARRSLTFWSRLVHLSWMACDYCWFITFVLVPGLHLGNWQNQRRRLLLICCYNYCCFLIDFLKGGRPDTWRLYPRGLRSFGGSTEEIYGALAWNGIVVSSRLPQVCNILHLFYNHLEKPPSMIFNVRWHPLTLLARLILF